MREIANRLCRGDGEDIEYPGLSRKSGLRVQVGRVKRDRDFAKGDRAGLCPANAGDEKQ